MPAVGKRSDVLKRAMDRLGRPGGDLEPSQEVQEDALNNTIDEYSRIRPNPKSYELAGDNATQRVVLNGVTGWRKGSSRVGTVAHVTSPGTNAEKVEEKDLTEWAQVKAANADDVLMLAEPIPTGKTLRASWDDLHVVHETDVNLTTVPETDAEPFVGLIAANLAEWCARKASDQQSLKLGADVVDVSAPAKNWSFRAKELRDAAMARLAPKSDTARGAGSSVEWETESSAGQRWLGH